MNLYILKNGKPVHEPDLVKFGRWFETADRVIDKSTAGQYCVSTVFLGIDHNFSFNLSSRGKAVLFETMVFGPDKYNEYTWRYTTLGDAKKGHAAIVDALLNDRNLDEIEIDIPK